MAERPDWSEGITDEILRQYLRPWYAPMSITIYVDIKTMALEILRHRHGGPAAEVMLEAAEKNPLTPAEAEAMRGKV